MSPSPPLLHATAITKNFPGVRSLDAVDFTLQAGHIHALMGENGAGKSTLIKVLTGVYPRDGGAIHINGAPIEPRSPLHATTLGISTVYQEVNLVPGLSVAENLYLGRYPRKPWGIDWATTYRLAHDAVTRLNLHIDVRRPVSAYSVAIQQMIAIARALEVNAKVLILDEPTSSLDAGEVKLLFAAMRKLRDQGLGIVFVTHFLDQVYEVTDRITVLRNGKLVGEYPTANLPRLELVARMMGKQLSELEHMQAEKEQEKPNPNRKIFLQAKALGRAGSLEPFDIDIAAGETVGLAGLLGSGRTEMTRLLFGIDKPDEGTLSINNTPTRITNPRKAIKLGLGLCTEDRKVSGIIPDLSVRENIILVLQSQRGWWRKISRRKQNEIANHYIKALNIKTSDAEKAIKFLSGGNQQKAILARWLLSKPKLLILDEPTRGIDVGAKVEITKLMDALRHEGMALLFISSELEEVVRTSQRVIVLRDRKKVGELTGEQINEASIMSTIASHPAG